MVAAPVGEELPPLRSELKVIYRERRSVPLDEYKGGRDAALDDVSELVTGSTVIKDTEGHPIVAYLELDHDFTALRRALDASADWEERPRSAGAFVARSIKFGKSPARGNRQLYCSDHALGHRNPELQRLLMDTGNLILPYYRALNAELFAFHAEQVSRVHPAWVWNPAFTSGIVNHNSQLPYHHDAGNFRSVWSGMFGLKQDIREGALAIPELDLALEIADGSLTMFDGQGLLHGVTPIHKRTSKGTRYTIVYYGLKGMWSCLDPAEEANKGNVLRTAREARRVERDRAKLSGGSTPT